MNLWFETYLNHSKRDQLSFMYAVWKTNLKIDTININTWANDWMKHSKHTNNKEIKDCRIYYSDSTIDEIYNYKLDYTYNYKIKDNNYSFKAIVPQDTNIMEIDICNVPCTKYSNLKITLPYEQIIIYNTITYKDDYIFYNDHGVIRLEGDFKKGQKYELSCNLQKLTELEKNEFIEFLCNDLIILSEEIEYIKNTKTHKIRNRLGKIKKFFIKKG